MENKPLKHGLLYGSYDLTIDDKNRMLIPSDLRRCILPERDGEALFLITGINRKPWFYPERRYEELAERPADLAPGDDLLAFDQMYFGQTSRLEWDKQGRILVPDKILKKTGTLKEVTLVGARDHMELWNRADWAAREEELDRQRIEIALRTKSDRQTLPRE